MYQLSSPITITPPPITKADGTVKTFNPIVFSAIDYSVFYDDTRKVASAVIKGVNRQIVLWQGAAYDLAGQWTDSDTDARVKEVLGSDPTSFLTNLLAPRGFVTSPATTTVDEATPAPVEPTAPDTTAPST
jgi:hypothetical protein